MFFLKQCPKCNGDLSTDSDQYGEFVSCLQCSMCKDIQAVESRSLVPHTHSSQSTRAVALSKEGYRINALHTVPARQREAILA